MDEPRQPIRPLLLLVIACGFVAATSAAAEQKRAAGIASPTEETESISAELFDVNDELSELRDDRSCRDRLKLRQSDEALRELKFAELRDEHATDSGEMHRLDRQIQDREAAIGRACRGY